MSDEVYISQPRTCTVHEIERGESVTAGYDARMITGQWADLCEACFRRYGIGLGTGGGQRLILGPKPPVDEQRRRSQIRAALNAGDLAMAEDLVGEDDLSDYLD